MEPAMGLVEPTPAMAPSLRLLALFSLAVIFSFLQESEQTMLRKNSGPSDNGKCDCVCGDGQRKQRIVGGWKAEAHEFPWIAMLSYAGTFYCGGTLLTDRHLLTAAHCVHGKWMRELRVTLGEHNRDLKDDGEEVIRNVKKITVHANFSLARIEHDIAIVELSKPVDIGGPNIRTACLPTQVGRNYSGSEGVVAGWGRLSEKGSTSGTLMKVAMPLLSREECSKLGYPPKRITKDVFCAGHPKGKKDACQGDSGGPMHLNGTSSHQVEVIGVVSWGRGCGRPNYPGVYARVDRYLNWIKQNLGGQCLCRHPARNTDVETARILSRGEDSQ